MFFFTLSPISTLVKPFILTTQGMGIRDDFGHTVNPQVHLNQFLKFSRGDKKAVFLLVFQKNHSPLRVSPVIFLIFGNFEPLKIFEIFYILKFSIILLTKTCFFSLLGSHPNHPNPMSPEVF